VPVVRLSALHDGEFEALGRAIEAVLEDPGRATPGRAGARTRRRWRPTSPRGGAAAGLVDARAAARAQALALWALLSIDERDELTGIPPELRARCSSAAGRDRAGRQVDAEVISGRYGWIDARIGRFVHAQAERTRASERIDGVLLNPWLGFR
jgi:hypothetical protein